MGVHRKWLTILLLSLVSAVGYAQTAEKSFSFNNDLLPEAVQEIVEAFGLYVSFDPVIFRKNPPVSFNMKTSSLEEALDVALGDRFSYQVINEYVVIKPRKHVQQKPPSTPAEPERRILYDTIVIEQTEIYYDTVRVESVENIQVYDTTIVEKEVIIYDTIKYSVQKPEDNHRFLAYLAPTLWWRANASLAGASIGLSYRREWKNFYLEVGLAYNYSMQNVSFSQTETLTELQVDTVSTFFIIENEERIPVYVIDSAFIERELVREVDRTNTLHQLTLVLLAGKAFATGERVTIGINAGISLDWIFQANEVTEPGSSAENNRSMNVFSYRIPLQNLRLELPLMYRVHSLNERYYLAPYGELGLNSDFENRSISSERYRFGVKLGLFF